LRSFFQKATASPPSQLTIQNLLNPESFLNSPLHKESSFFKIVTVAAVGDLQAAAFVLYDD